MSLNKFSQYPARTELNPTPRIEQTNLVAVTSDNKDTLVPADQLIPGVAYNATDGDPRPMISGEVWNEQEQIREAFTAGPAFALPHFRYVADDYFWKSIAKDKAFYYLTDMKLLTYPLTWDPSTSTSAATPALHLSWLRAPDQTQIFKFIDGTSASSLGAIILQNRTNEMVSADPEEVRVNQCSASTHLKEVQVTVKSTDGSPLYVNFPDADVSLTIAQKDSGETTLSNIKLSSDTTSDVSWRTLTINTQATALSNMFTGATGAKVCEGTVYLNAPSATSVTDCFGGDYQVGDGVTGTVPDVRPYLPSLNSSYTFYENFPLGRESVLTTIQNLSTTSAVAASGSFDLGSTVTTLPFNTISINGIAVPAVTSTAASNLAADIVTAINGNTYLSSMVTATKYSATRVTLTAKKKGTLGNNITLTTSDSTNFPVSGAKLAGGLSGSGTADVPVLTIGIDTALGAVYDEAAWIPMDEEIQKLAEDLDGIWAISWKPVAVEGGSNGWVSDI